MAPVQALSERFEVETVRNGTLHRARFAKGVLVEPLQHLGPTKRRGTRIRYRPDRAVFGDARHDVRALRGRLTELAMLLPTVQLRWQGRRIGDGSGLPGLLRRRGVAARNTLLVSGEVADVVVELALGWRSAKRPRLDAFVNCVRIESGTHLEAVDRLVRAAAQERGLVDEVMSGLVCVMNVWMLHPRFEGPTKARLATEEVVTAVHTLTASALKRAPWWLDSILERLPSRGAPPRRRHR